jgi:hypothetical protein
MSEAGRIGGVFYDPVTAFADIAAHPRWAPPLALVIIASIVLLFCFSQRVGWESLVRKQMETNERVQNLPADQKARAIEQGAKFAAPVSYASAVLGPPIVVLIITGVLMLVFNTMMGASITFRQMFAMTNYSNLTGLISVALALVVMYLTPPADYDLQSAVSFDLGAFVSTDGPKWLKSLAGSFDVFRFWSMALLVIGIRAAAKRISLGKAVLGVVAPWLVWVLGKTAVVAVWTK